MARDGYYMAKAFDNRVGMAGVIQAGQALAGANHPNRLILCGTVQEELGLRGAKTAAAMTKPDVAIVLEGPPADDAPGFSRADCQGRLGGGVQIRMFDPSAVGNPRFARLAIDVAHEEGIPHQVTVRRSGGTDAGAFHLANEGVPCVVLGVPARYIHSHNAMIDLNDYLTFGDHEIKVYFDIRRHRLELDNYALEDYWAIKNCYVDGIYSEKIKMNRDTKDFNHEWLPCSQTKTESNGQVVPSNVLNQYLKTFTYTNLTYDEIEAFKSLDYKEFDLTVQEEESPLIDDTPVDNTSTEKGFWEKVWDWFASLNIKVI